MFQYEAEEYLISYPRDVGWGGGGGGGEGASNSLKMSVNP